MKLYNSLTKTMEQFEPLDQDGKTVGVYGCGPTVYFYPHVGNWRTFVLGDVLVRSLKYLGYKPRYVMNITDVGHLTGDNLGDASAGEDRLEKAALKEGKTAWDVAQFYTTHFVEGFEKLGLVWPNGKVEGERKSKEEYFCKATDYIAEQIEMTQAIEKRGFTYVIADGVYFDVRAYEKAGNTYGLMSNIHKDDTQARIAKNEAKRDERDFALWKFSPDGEKRQMEWESPWGVGFPGWHIECSAMSVKYLGSQFDIHLGGEDHKSTHHPNEIAQSEAATGKKPFVKYWLHGAFLQVDGGRMGKSLGNAYTLDEVMEKGFSPFDLRYFYLTGHYRKVLNFTWEGLSSARSALVKLAGHYAGWTSDNTGDGDKAAGEYRTKFRAALENDLHMPQALAVLWQVVGDEQLSGFDKKQLVDEFDAVLGLRVGLVEIPAVEQSVPTAILELATRRDELRSRKDWSGADEVRVQLAELGYEVVDTAHGGVVRRKQN